MNLQKKIQLRNIMVIGSLHLVPVRNNLYLKTGEGRGVQAREGNYREVLNYLQACNCNTDINAVQVAVGIIKDLLAREFEVVKPAEDNGAARKLQILINDSSTVTLTHLNIDVRLDNDQLKHQHPLAPIGTRRKGGGNRFIALCNAAWHQDIAAPPPTNNGIPIPQTMLYMATWAISLGAMAIGAQIYHGQFTPVNHIHYEGYCLQTNGTKFVLFHCYPGHASPFKW